MNAQVNPDLQNDEVNVATDSDTPNVQWGESAPKGGRTVMNRILRDGAKVPLFLGQTLVKSLRDLGYNDTTSAICEHVDNAIQWGASEVRVYFHQTGRRGNFNIDVLILDNGQGMSPNVLKVATAFGGSMVFDERSGIGRYGMGMKAAALSMSPVLDIYSWQESGAIYNMTLDVEDIGTNRANLVELPDPVLIEMLPSDVTDLISRPMIYPKRPDETQELLTDSVDELQESLGDSGTIIFMPECDRLTFKQAKTLVDHATLDMARIYRRQISNGLQLYINNRLVEASDPTYWMPDARHTRAEGLSETRSRLVKSWKVKIRPEKDADPLGVASVKLYALPFEEWSQLPRKVQRNDLRIFDGRLVSYLRNGREVQSGSDKKLRVSSHHTNNWLRVEVEFPGELDEAFGVAANKQGVRPKDFVYDCLVGEINEELASLRAEIARKGSEMKARQSGSKLSEAERRATDAETTQSRPLPGTRPETEEERAVQEQNLRALAVTLKRENETDQQAFERLKNSDYVVNFKHDHYWPFYHCDFKFGKVILTINSAHPFFERLWQPLSDLAANGISRADADDSDEDDLPEPNGSENAEVLVALQLLLLSLARTQSQMSAHDDEGRREVFEMLRRQWSENLKTQLAAR